MEKSLPKINTPKGFTLVELMVVVAIIAILAAIGVTVFSGQQKNARDARRRADIDAIASALESKKGTAVTYPVLATTDFANGAIPTDSTTAQYSVCYTTTSGQTVNANKPVAWLATSANPPVAGNPVTNCATPTVGQAWYTIGTAAPAASSYSWIVCALLENGTNPNVYCRSNAQ